MITDLPTEDDFKALAEDCLIKAYDMVYEVDNYFIIPEIAEADVFSGGASKDDIDEFNELYDEERRNQIYQHYSQDLRTAVILVHQGMEALAKAEVCKISPYLLLSADAIQWPVLPQSENKSFADLHTISGEELLRVYAALRGASMTDEMASFYEEVRKTRNRLQHGGKSETPESKKIIKLILKTFTLYVGKGEWWRAYWRYWERDPMYAKGEIGSEFYVPSRHLRYAEKVLGLSELSRHFEIDFEASRSYYCPTCNLDLLREAFTKGDKWAYYIESSSEVYCACCMRTNSVDKTKCRNPECKGELIGEDDFCLTCFEEQEQVSNATNGASQEG